MQAAKYQELLRGDAPQKVLDQYKPKPFQVYPENWDIVQLFLALATQWQFAGMGQRVGINYLAIEPTARLIGMEMTPEAFNAIRLMEASALETWRNGKS